MVGGRWRPPGDLADSITESAGNTELLDAIPELTWKPPGWGQGIRPPSRPGGLGDPLGEATCCHDPAGPQGRQVGAQAMVWGRQGLPSEI